MNPNGAARLGDQVAVQVGAERQFAAQVVADEDGAAGSENRAPSGERQAGTIAAAVGSDDVRLVLDGARDPVRTQDRQPNSSSRPVSKACSSMADR